MITKQTKFLIVGLGVMGGSYAKALSKKGYQVKCITQNQSDVDYALAHGMVTDGSIEVKQEFLDWADVIVFAVYPAVFLDWIRTYRDRLNPHALLTDVTGVKQGIVKKVQSELDGRAEFISAHPMAGRERSGVEFADDKVFEGANYIVTPTEKNTETAIQTCKQLGEILGFSRISVLTPEKHDRMVAFLSQLTHCIAVSLMTCNEEKDLEKFTGDSFRDLTRIAKINDKMWSELFVWNKSALIEQMNRFIAEFEEFRDLIADENVDKLREKMQISTKRRALFDKPKGNV